MKDPEKVKVPSRLERVYYECGSFTFAAGIDGIVVACAEGGSETINARDVHRFHMAIEGLVRFHADLMTSRPQLGGMTNTTIRGQEDGCPSAGPPARPYA